MRLIISHDGKKGEVHYDSLGKEVWVSHPDSTVRKVANHFFKSKRAYSIATERVNENHIGQDLRVYGRGVDNHSYMLQAASELRAHTGIKVHWDDSDIK